MKQNIKIMISKDETSKEGVWVSFPINQRDFDMLTQDKELQPDTFDIPTVVCNSYNLSQLLMNRARPPSFLTKLNYLGQIFSEFDRKKRTEFGFLSDFLLDQTNTLDDYIDLALNIRNGETEFGKHAIRIPPEFRLTINPKKPK